MGQAYIARMWLVIGGVIATAIGGAALWVFGYFVAVEDADDHPRSSFVRRSIIWERLDEVAFYLLAVAIVAIEVVKAAVARVVFCVSRLWVRRRD